MFVSQKEAFLYILKVQNINFNSYRKKIRANSPSEKQQKLLNKI